MPRSVARTLCGIVHLFLFIGMVRGGAAVDSQRLNARAVIDQLTSDPRFKERFGRQVAAGCDALPSFNRSGRVYQDEPIIMTGAQMGAFLPPAGRKARELARTPQGRAMGAAELFCAQARILADAEDDVPYRVPFECYRPTYDTMSDRQLRSYLSWRTGLRRGEAEQADASYLFVYCYELLNGVGAEGPMERFVLLRRFLEDYRDVEPLLGKYVPGWLWDLAAYYGLDRSLVANDPLLNADIARDEALSVVLNREEREPWEVFRALDMLSSYHVLKSRFCKEHPKDLAAVSLAVLKDLEPYCAKHRVQGLYEGLFGKSLTLSHAMFGTAIFYERQPHPDAVYEFDPIQRFTCVDGRWRRSFYPDTAAGASRLGAILKAVDARMRERYDYGHALQHPKTPKYLANIIEKAIDDYLVWKQDREVRAVSIDLSKLGAIRVAAAATREALLVDEEREDEARPTVSKAAPEKFAAVLPESVPVMAGVPVAAKLVGSAPADGTNPLGLTDAEHAFLLRLLEGVPTGDLLSGAVTEELLVDAINDKLFDLLGDTAVEFVGPEPSIVEDYRDEVKGAVCP